MIHSYRHRLGNAPGEPRFEAVERQLAERPKIEVPTIVLHGADDALDRAPRGNAPRRARVIPDRWSRAGSCRLRTLHAARKTGSRVGGDAGSAGGDEVAGS